MTTKKAENIVTVPENPAPVKIDTPKVTAAHELPVPEKKTAVTPSNTPSNSIPPISFDILLSMGIVEKNRAGKYNSSSDTKSAREYLKSVNPTLASKVDSDSLAVLLASVGQNTEAVKRAGKKVALAMALVDVNHVYKQYGYKNTSSLFRALYPTLADSTVWNYINTGKEIYLPAQAKNAPWYLKELADLEPGTALFAVGVLRDENASKRFPSLLRKAMKDKGGKLTQSALKTAAKEARNPETKAKEDSTAGTEKKDAKASAEMSKNAWKALVRRGMTIEIKGNERYIYIYENLMKSAKELLKAASKDEKSALDFVDALIDALNI